MLFLEVHIGNKSVYLYNCIRKINISRDGNVVHGNYLDVNLMNYRIDFKPFKLVKFRDLKYNESLIQNINSTYLLPDGVLVDDYLMGIANREGFTLTEETYVFILKPEKKLLGKKMTLEVDLIYPDYVKYISSSKHVVEIDVYASPFTKKGKDVVYSTHIPENLFVALHEIDDHSKIPSNRLIENVLISELKKEIENYAEMVDNHLFLQSETQKSKKFIAVKYSSSVDLTRDDFNHAYTGDLVKTNFQYFIVYERPNRANSLSGNYSTYFTYTKVKNGELIDVKSQNKYCAIGNNTINQYYKLIEWTEERELFLKSVSDNFKKLKDNLDNFLSDLNNEKLDRLITESPTFSKLLKP